MNEKLISELMNFGLSRQETLIYLEMLKHEQMTGYEISKETGISRSNVYSSLSELFNKGAVYMIETESAKYIPVAPEKFLMNTINTLKEKIDFILKNIPSKKEISDGYITIKGSQNIKNKIRDMLEKTESRIYMLAQNDVIKNFETELSALVSRKVKIVIISDCFELKGAKIYKTKIDKNQIRFIVDSSYVLTGQFSFSQDDTCLYSGQQNLVEVMKEYLKNKITLLEQNSKS